MQYEHIPALSQLKAHDPDEDYESDEYFETDKEQETAAPAENPVIFTAPQFTRPNDLIRSLERQVGNSSVKLNCFASGYPIPDVAWLKDGQPLTRSGTHLSRWGIALDELQADDSGIYQCKVCNSVDCITHEFNVTVSRVMEESPAHFTKKMDYTSKIYRPMGNMVKLKCPGAGVPEPSITWQKNDQPIVRKMEQQVTYSKWGIVLEDIIMEDTGNYTCRICNTGGCQSFTYEVFVQGKSSRKFPVPENLIAMRVDDVEEMGGQVNEEEDEEEGAKVNVTTNEIERAPFFSKPGGMNILEKRPSGSTFSFRCPYGGYPKPNITWTKDGLAIDRKLGNVRRRNSSITLEELIGTDSGKYKCEVCNSLGCISHVFKFEVIGKLRWNLFASERLRIDFVIFNDSPILY